MELREIGFVLTRFGFWVVEEVVKWRVMDLASFMKSSAGYGRIEVGLREELVFVKSCTPFPKMPQQGNEMTCTTKK